VATVLGGAGVQAVIALGGAALATAFVLVTRALARSLR
jgi:hypothetical protein